MPDFADIPGIPELWELTLGDPSVRVASIDGPVDLDHPCFAGAGLTVVEPSWLPAELTPLDDLDSAGRRRKHGTWVASVLFGQHGSEVAGLAPSSTGLIVPSLRGDLAEADPVNTARAVEAAVEAGAAIVLFEMCFASLSGDVDHLFKRALRQAARSGVLLVAGSGNAHGECTCFPAASPDVLAVGAYDDDGRVFGFSNWGSEYEGHGLVAPGGNISGALPGGGTKAHKGTSCSGPVVAGVAALLASLRVKHGAVPDPLGVREALLQTAAPCSADETDGEPKRCIAGRLDVPAATKLVLSQLRANGHARRAAAKESADGHARDADAAPSSLAAVGVRGASPAPSSADAGLPGLTQPGTLVFALGALGYDFGSEPRRDAFERFMATAGVPPAEARDPRRVVEHLAGNPADAPALIWTLSIDGEPTYAVQPVGPYAADVFAQLVRLLAAQLPTDGRGQLDRVSMPGRLAGGRVELYSGEAVAVVQVDGLRGLHGLSVAVLAEAAAAQVQPAPDRSALVAAVQEFLTRVYVDLANLGCTPPQRALNFAATNVRQAAEVFAGALARGMVLERIDTQRSAMCRQDSDCWDVRLRFFDPDNGRRARQVFRFTIDVSDLYPVTLGTTQAWAESAAARVAA